MDEETKKEWEKSKRIDEERMKAARHLANHQESKANQAFLTPEKPHGFSRDPNVIIKNAEKMANVSIVFTLLGIIFGIFLQVFSIESFAFKLGFAGTGISMGLGIAHSIGMGVGTLTGLVALISMTFLARRISRNLKPAMITAVISLALIAIYYIVQNIISRA